MKQERFSPSELLTIVVLMSYAIGVTVYVLRLETRIAVLESHERYSHGDLTPYLAKGQ